MPLTSSTTILREAVAARRVIVAFNVFSAESTAAVIRAAEDSGAPVIVSVNEEDLGHLGAEEIAAIARVKAERARVPVVLHLDHGMSISSVMLCLRAGFTSVMIDPSRFSEREGLATVRTVAMVCHAVGVPVESMVGRLRLAAGLDGEGAHKVEELTDPSKVRAFIEETGIDSLAVSVGTEHGSYLVGRKAEIDMTLLKEIASRVDTPLVIHGGSAVGGEQLKELRQHGVGKVNVGSAIRAAFKSELIKALGEDMIDIRDASIRGEEAMYAVAREKIGMLTL